MALNGKDRRLKRIFNPRTGRSVLTPIDHGIWSGPIAGIESPARVLDQVLAGGTDALLLNPGFVKDLGDRIPTGVGLIVRISTGTELAPSANQEYVFSSIERAIRLGADAVAVTVYPEGADAQHAIAALGHVIDAAERYALPVLAEFLPLGPADGDRIAHMARIGYELGADIVKVSYPGDPSAFRRAVERCPLPILVAGGDPLTTPEAIASFAFDAVGAGAAGTAIGRNSWQNSSPATVVRSLSIAVHEQDLEAAKREISAVTLTV